MLNKFIKLGIALALFDSFGEARRGTHLPDQSTELDPYSPNTPDQGPYSPPDDTPTPSWPDWFNPKPDPYVPPHRPSYEPDKIWDGDQTDKKKASSGIGSLIVWIIVCCCLSCCCNLIKQQQNENVEENVDSFENQENMRQARLSSITTNRDQPVGAYNQAFQGNANADQPVGAYNQTFQQQRNVPNPQVDEEEVAGQAQMLAYYQNLRARQQSGATDEPPAPPSGTPGGPQARAGSGSMGYNAAVNASVEVNASVDQEEETERTQSVAQPQPGYDAQPRYQPALQRGSMNQNEVVGGYNNQYNQQYARQQQQRHSVNQPNLNAQAPQAGFPQPGVGNNNAFMAALAQDRMNRQRLQSQRQPNRR